MNTLSLYCGKGGARSQHGSGFDLVTDLVNPFYNKWHHVLVDNAFCSPHLCHYLLERNTYITGTVRVHRKGMPSSFKRIRVPKGEREVRQQGQLMAMKYGDRKQVTFLSTFSDPRCVSYIYISKSVQITFRKQKFSPNTNENRPKLFLILFNVILSSTCPSSIRFI